MKSKLILLILLIITIGSTMVESKSNLHYYVNPKDIIPKENMVDVYLNDRKLEFDITPYTKKGHTMVQLRPIYEKFGLSLLWNNKSKTVIGIKDDINISLTLGDNIININDKKIFSEIKPYTLDGHTMIPIRVIAESLGAKVVWDSLNNSVNIELEE